MKVTGLLAGVGAILLMGGNNLGVILLIPALVMLINKDLASGK